MTTSPNEHELGAGQTLVANVSQCQTPFGFTVTADDWTGTSVAYDASISREPDDWIDPERNASITDDVSDYELDPLRFMRFRHLAGAGAVTVRIGAVGRVSWEVS